MAYRSMFTGEPQAILEKYYPEKGSRRVIQEILKRTGLKFSQSQIVQRAAHTGIRMSEPALRAVTAESLLKATKHSLVSRASAGRHKPPSASPGRYVKPDYLTLADLSLSPWALLCVSWGAATKPCRRPERMGDPHYA